VSLADAIRGRLAALEPLSMELLDESEQHLGHAGYKAGGSHFRVTIVSEQFRGMNSVQRHRRVYEVLGPLMQEVHALAIRALTPDEL
jgi:BolA family transcriptional regulator, general stress-responsive regulator